MVVKVESFVVNASVKGANASRYAGKAPLSLSGRRTVKKRAVAQYLAGLETGVQSQHEVSRDNGGSSGGGGTASSDRKPLKVISQSDPSSA